MLRRDRLLPWQKRVVSLLITAKDAETKRYSTRYSRVVTQRSTDLAQSSLPSVIGRDRGYSGWYDRSIEATAFHRDQHLDAFLHSISSLSGLAADRCQLPTPAHPGANTSCCGTCQRGLAHVSEFLAAAMHSHGTRPAA